MISVTLAALALVAGVQQPAGTVVVSAVEPGLAAERAGLRPGDRLLCWSRDGASGSLASPFDLEEVALEHGPRGSLRLIGRRGDARVEATLDSDAWGLAVRPGFSPEGEALLQVAVEHAAAGAADAALGELGRLAARGESAAWIWLQAARTALAAGRLETVEETLGEALRAAEQEGQPAAVRAQLLSFLGEARLRLGQPVAAAEALRAALATREERAPEALATALLLEPLALACYESGTGMEALRPRLDALRQRLESEAPRSLALARVLTALAPIVDDEPAARALLQQALGLEQALAPDGLLMARTLRRLAAVVNERERKLELARRSLEIRERLVPGGAEVADSLSQIAVHLNRYGNPGEAEEHFRRALAIEERLDPEGARLARLLTGLALLRRGRGDLGEASRLYERAIALHEQTGSENIWLAITLLNYGETLRQSWELEEAERQLLRSSAIVEREAPESDVAGYVRATLGAVLQRAGDAEAAEAEYRRALAVMRVAAPASQLVPYVLLQLGSILAEERRFDDGRALFREAIDRTLDQLPGSLALADMHAGAAALELEAGAPAAAEPHLRRALELCERLSPGSLLEAELHHGLARVARHEGRRDEALQHLRAAVAALEAQSLRLGGDRDTAARYRAEYQGYYRDLEELLLELGREREAFEAVERSRSRALLALLSHRDLHLDRDLDPELARQRAEADAGYDAALRSLARAGADSQRFEAELAAARVRRDDARARLRAAAPRLAALSQPHALDLAGVRAALGEGTLLVAFSAGRRTLQRYAVGPGPDDFSASSLPVDEDALRLSVESLREAIATRRAGALQGAVVSASRRLSERLLAGLGPAVERAERILFVPDGALQVLPFAALRDPTRPAGDRYLVEARPVHVVASVTLYSLLARAPAAAAEPLTAVGFGDPDYGERAETGGGSSLRSASRQSFTPLPRTRDELDALRLLAPGRTRLYMGRDATEERASSIERVGVLHLACHGFFDDRFPLESGLALTIPASPVPGQENGLLQAWEVFEEVRLDADLVTLSACQTAQGREVPGEGMLGLIWAFQYAGARSILASLWEVDDASTAELMRAFYRRLAAGDAASEALRRAQLELLRRPERAAPFYWAAFQLTGDWRPRGSVDAAAGR